MLGEGDGEGEGGGGGEGGDARCLVLCLKKMCLKKSFFFFSTWQIFLFYFNLGAFCLKHISSCCRTRPRRKDNTVQYSTRQDDTRQDNKRQYSACCRTRPWRKDNTVQYSTRQDNTSKIIQDKATKDNTVQYSTREDHSTQANNRQYSIRQYKII